MSFPRIQEILVLVDAVERLLRAEAAHRERNQIGEIVQHIEKVSTDGSITALANHVAIAVSQFDLAGPLGSVAVIRALDALDRLRGRLLAMQAGAPG